MLWKLLTGVGSLIKNSENFGLNYAKENIIYQLNLGFFQILIRISAPQVLTNRSMIWYFLKYSLFELSYDIDGDIKRAMECHLNFLVDNIPFILSKTHS